MNEKFLAGLQSNSGLWIDDVRLSVCPAVRPSVRPSVCPSVCLSTFWLTSAFKFIRGHINQNRLDTLHGNRPWWDLLNCDLSLWPWPSLFSSPEPKARVSYCHSASSVVRPSVRPSSSVVRKLFTFSTSSPERLDGFWWNLVGMKYSWSLTSVVVFRPDPPRGGSRAGQK